MKELFNKISIGMILALASVSLAHAGSIIDDGDLTGPRIRRRPFDSAPSAVLNPDSIEVRTTGGSQPAILVVREEKDTLQTIDGLTFKTTQLTNQQCRLTASLDSKRYRIEGSRDVYQIVADVPCGKPVTLRFKQQSNGGQALGIWRIATLAQAKLLQSVGLEFWRSQISFIWPADGDYYSNDEVHITLGHQWDVVGHELGHAIYDQAGIGVFGGGSHKIDECYSDALALSEGWATFFSAWLSLDLNDKDAKFEYLVPRRAPIRIENVPADVCKGPKNEWRVSSFFWDLVDLNPDGENAQFGFDRLWKATLNAGIRNMAGAIQILEKAGFDRTQLDGVSKLNFNGATTLGSGQRNERHSPSFLGRRF